jgi:uncharacterized membrane protein YGL010W
VLNVVGGTAVLASYASAFRHPPEVRDALWGGVPTALQPVYTASMLAAALGYFSMTWLFVFGKPAYPDARRPHHDRAMLAAYGLILGPSARWLPLTVELILAPNALLYWLVRLVLFGVAAGALIVLVRTAQHARAGKGALRWLPLAGALAFCLQTVVLDALVWPAFYPL